MQLEEVRFHHVAKHLYQPAEQWDQVIPNLGDARERAWKAGCAERTLESEHPDLKDALPSCTAHVLRDHDLLLKPAYMAEISSADQAGRAGSYANDPRAWAFVGDKGVFVIVRETGSQHRPEVKTAYRIKSWRSQLPEAFFKRATAKLRDKTGWK